MENVSVKSLYQSQTHDQEVEISLTGWLKTLRSSKKSVS